MRNLLVIMLLTFFSAQARILNVPNEFLTIQSALDSLQNGDTVLVESGVYVETLSAPSLTFSLIGAADDDSARPVIDPTALPGSDTLASLTLSNNDHVIIRNFIFRNGAEMRNDRGPPAWSGGIINNASALYISNCVFDSVSGAIWGVDTLFSDSCNFIGCVNRAISTTNGTVIANQCVFDGQGLFYLVRGGSGSRFRHCQFSGTLGYLLQIAGDSIQVDSCDFGPYGPYGFSVINHFPESGCEIKNCLFHDCIYGNALIELDPDCNEVESTPLKISGNTFIRNSTYLNSQGRAIHIWCQEGDYQSVQIFDNRFDSISTGPLTMSSGIATHSCDLIQDNIFGHLTPLSAPKVYIMNNPVEDQEAALHFNLFLSEGMAVQNLNAELNAEYNWWGHATGPYHPVLNPSGLGAEVSNNVDFEPWLEDSIISAVPRQPRAEVLSYSLTAFPNPFNASTTIRYDLKMAGHTDLKIYNVIGQEVETLVYATQSAGRHVIRFHAADLPNGIYFYRLSGKSFTKTAKMVLMR